MTQSYSEEPGNEVTPTVSITQSYSEEPGNEVTPTVSITQSYSEEPGNEVTPTVSITQSYSLWVPLGMPTCTTKFFLPPFYPFDAAHMRKVPGSPHKC